MEKAKISEIECPLCEGTGLVVKWALIKNTAKIRIAHALRDEGYSHREIMKMMGYKSPRSISVLLEQKIVD